MVRCTLPRNPNSDYFVRGSDPPLLAVNLPCGMRLELLVIPQGLYNTPATLRLPFRSY
ncbi:hypothetical protein Plhal304r1_c009g0035671 [Plasmopara halstedii]